MDEEEVRNSLEGCIDALRVWMNTNRLKLNDKKIEFIIFGTFSGLKKAAKTAICVGRMLFQHVLRCVTLEPCLTHS